MKRNTAYVASQPISEEIYDEVELPECERSHARKTKEGVKSKAKEMSTDGKKSTKSCMVLAFVIGVLSNVLLLSLLAVASVQMSALSELQSKPLHAWSSHTLYVM